MIQTIRNFFTFNPVKEHEGVKAEKAENQIKVRSIFERSMVSRVVPSVLGSTLLSAIGATVLSGGVSAVPFAIVRSALGAMGPAAMKAVVYGGVALGVSLLARGFSNPKKLLYEISIINTVVLNKWDSVKYPWWNEVTQGVYLSAQPQKSLGHFEEMKKLAGGRQIHVITMLEEHEVNGFSPWNEAYTQNDYQILGIEQTVVDTPDFLPVPQDKIKSTVARIKEIVEDGGIVFVHCKAGRGRSATAVVCHMLENYQSELNNVDADAAIKYVKDKRSVISINSRQKRAITTYAEQFNKI